MREANDSTNHAGDVRQGGAERIAPELEAALRAQGHALRQQPVTDAQAATRTIDALRAAERGPVVAVLPAGRHVPRWVVAAAACVAVVIGASLMARIDGKPQEQTPSASAVISSTLRGFPRQPQDVVRIAATPLKKEAQKLAQGSKRMLGGLDLFSKHATER